MLISFYGGSMLNNFLIFAFLFFIGCVVGWGIEVIFRRFNRANKSRKWINPGFLAGPYLPLYGFGLCVLFALASIENYIPVEAVAARKVILFLLMALCMTIIEYITGIIFIKKMHVKLWDYSGRFMNIDGIICPLFSFFWALLSAVYYFFVNPYIQSALTWFSNNLTFSFFIGMFYGVLIIDIFYSFKILAKIRRFAEENNISVKYENFKEQIRAYSEAHTEKYKFMFAFKSKISIKEHLKAYLERLRSGEQSNIHKN